jgi:hypothetical protein
MLKSQGRIFCGTEETPYVELKKPVPKTAFTVGTITPHQATNKSHFIQFHIFKKKS